MMPALASSGTLASFAATIGARLGLRVDERAGQGLVQRRAAARGQSVAAYLCQFDEPGELRVLASELTVGETYFFRHSEQLDAFTEVALPARLAARAPDRQLEILSAGCASGEEPYTLAMLLRDRLPADLRVALHGADIDPRALERAVRGRYSRWAMRAVPEAIEHRWFQSDGNTCVLAPEIRAQVALAEHNLAGDSPLWSRTWDMVFCRNVLMYFTPAQAEALLARIAGALAPGGYLFLGHAEIVWARGPAGTGRAGSALAELEACGSHGTFYYRRRTAAPRTVRSTGPLPIGGPLRAVASTPLPITAPIPAPAPPERLDDAIAALAAGDPEGHAQRLERALRQLAASGSNAGGRAGGRTGGRAGGRAGGCE